MRALILAAGRGRRLGALTDERPKCLTELHGVPLLEWQRAALRAAGFASIAVATGYRRSLVAHRAHAEFHNPRWADTNMVRTLLAAAPWFCVEPVLVAYADLVYHAADARRVMQQPGDIVVGYDPGWRALWEARFDDPLSDAEAFRMAADGRLVEIGGRASSLDAIEGQYVGLIQFTPAGFASWAASLSPLPEPDLDRLDMTSSFAHFLGGGGSISTCALREPWGEVDSPSDLAVYADFRSRAPRYLGT